MKTAVKIGIAVLVVTVTAWACSSSKIQGNMSTRQNILKSVYPALTSITRFFGVNSRVVMTEEKKAPIVSLYDIPFETISGEPSSFAAYKGKKIVIVNTASDCGYTGQYEELQSLYAQAKGEIIIVGFPANDFKEQEKGSNEQIASFCKKNYGVTFVLTEKIDVKGSKQHPIYKWLCNKSENDKSDASVKWNFNKFLIDENGTWLAYFPSSVKPLSEEITSKLK